MEVTLDLVLLALREADPVHPSAKPFKCPHCGSHCFGPTWRGKELAGRYCKGWPSDEDRSYKLCPAKYVEWYGQADQRGAAATCTEGASSETGESQNRASDGKLEAQPAPHHPGRQTLVTARNESGVDGPPPLITSASPGPMVMVPRETMKLIRLAFLPANPNRMRAADQNVVAAAREFISLAAAEEERSRG